MSIQLEKLNPDLRPLEAARTLRVGLLGLGTVGQGLCTLLGNNKDSLLSRFRIKFDVAKVLVRNPERARSVRPPGALLTNVAKTFLNGDFDAVVEWLKKHEVKSKNR